MSCGWDDGDVIALERDGCAGRGIAGGGEGAELTFVWQEAFFSAEAGAGREPPPPTPGKEEKEGIKEVTDDQRLELEPDGGCAPSIETGAGAASVVILFGPTFPTFHGFLNSGPGDSTTGCGGGLTTGTGTGLTHFSRNRTTGISAAIVACEFDGELGNGKWMTAFACGGGRGGAGVGGVEIDDNDDDNELSSPSHFLDCSRTAHARSHLSRHITSIIARCSSAALKWAAEGNGARSWHSTQISYPDPFLGLFVAK
jgi:hypothetical protein